MTDDFRTGLKVLEGREGIPRLTTGSADLDSLLGGGIEPGLFYLLYGDRKSGVDHLIHQILVNCLLPKEQNGFSGKAVYSNCGNYRREKTLLDTHLLGCLIKAAGLDPMKALDNIYVLCAFSEEQEEQTVPELQRLLDKEDKIRLIVVHNIAKLFTTKGSNRFGRDIIRLQHVVSKLKQMCAKKNVALVASCRPAKNAKHMITQPEGGKYLRHIANIIVHLRRRNRKTQFVTVHLRKHPNRPLRRVNLKFTIGLRGSALGRKASPLRTLLQQQTENLKMNYREALSDAPRRKAFDSLLSAWSSEQEAMTYAKVPTVLDIMWLTAIVDNRKLIEDLTGRLGIVNSKIDRIWTHLKTALEWTERSG